MGPLVSWLRRPLSQRSLFWFVLYRLRFPLVALAALFVLATCGYVAIEGFGWLDAAYMTVITLSTVGFREVHRLDSGGEVFTMAVIVLGFGGFVYAATMIADLFTSGSALEHLKESRGRRMRDELSAHVIVVGFGRVGQSVVKGLADLRAPCVVIDRNRDLEPAIRALGAVPLIGDASDEADLAEAGIDRARALVAAAERDDINLVVTLTARALAPRLRIISRVNEASWHDRIVRAGADVVQSPYPSYGLSLATSALAPTVLEFHSLPLLGLGTEEIEVQEGSPYVGHRLHELERQHHGVHIVGLRRDQRLQRWTDVADEIRSGDVLVALGTPEALRTMEDRAAHPPGENPETGDVAARGTA